MVQCALGHSRMQTTLDLLRTRHSTNWSCVTQEEFLDAVGFESWSVLRGL